MTYLCTAIYGSLSSMAMICPFYFCHVHAPRWQKWWKCELHIETIINRRFLQKGTFGVREHTAKLNFFVLFCVKIKTHRHKHAESSFYPGWHTFAILFLKSCQAWISPITSIKKEINAMKLQEVNFPKSQKLLASRAGSSEQTIARTAFTQPDIEIEWIAIECSE